MLREWTYTASSRDALGNTSLLSAVYGYSINPEMYYTVFSQSTSHDFSVPHHCINHDTGYFGVPHNIKDKLYYAQRAVSRSFFPAASDGCQCILTQIIHVSKNNFGIVIKRL